jgi:hypothetical protein
MRAIERRYGIVTPPVQLPYNPLLGYNNAVLPADRLVARGKESKARKVRSQIAFQSAENRFMAGAEVALKADRNKHRRIAAIAKRKAAQV